LGSYSTLKLLFETTTIKSNIYERNSYGLTPLHWVAFGTIETKEKIQYLLSQSANVNIPDKKGETVLHKAVLYGHNIELLEMLINSGANINFPNKQGETVIDVAKWNTSEVITYLRSIYKLNVKKEIVSIMSIRKFSSDYNPLFWNDDFIKKDMNIQIIISKSILL